MKKNNSKNTASCLLAFDVLIAKSDFVFDVLEETMCTTKEAYLKISEELNLDITLQYFLRSIVKIDKERYVKYLKKTVFVRDLEFIKMASVMKCDLNRRDLYDYLIILGKLKMYGRGKRESVSFDEFDEFCSQFDICNSDG